MAIINPATIGLATRAFAPLAKSVTAAAPRILPALRNFNFDKASQAISNNPKMGMAFRQHVMPKARQANEALRKNPSFQRFLSEVKQFMSDKAMSSVASGHDTQQPADQGQLVPHKNNAVVSANASKADGATDVSLAKKQGQQRNASYQFEDGQGNHIDVVPNARQHPGARQEFQVTFRSADGRSSKPMTFYLSSDNKLVPPAALKSNDTPAPDTTRKQIEAAPSPSQHR